MKCFGCGVEDRLIWTGTQKKDAGTSNGETAAPGPEQEDTQDTQQTEHQGDAGSGSGGSQAGGSGTAGPVSVGSGAVVEVTDQTHTDTEF